MREPKEHASDCPAYRVPSRQCTCGESRERAIADLLEAARRAYSECDGWIQTGSGCQALADLSGAIEALEALEEPSR